MGDPAPVDPPAAAPEVVADGSDGGAGSVIRSEERSENSVMSQRTKAEQ